jgi:O-antigen ligase
MGLGLLIYSRVFAWLRRRWLLLSIPPVILAIALFLATPTPFGHLFDLLTINSQTAYYRLYIWNSVGPAILDNPLFAVSDTDYDYHGSIDSLWLVLALEYGMPCAIFVALSMIGCCSRRIEWPARLSEEERKLGTVLGIIMFLMIFMSFTVDFWGPTWIMVGLLVGLRANLGECASLNTEPPVVVSELVA